MPSLLSNYNRAASNRVPKFIRAIDSVAAQTFTNWEMIIVSDGCDITTDETIKYLFNHRELSNKIIGIYVKRTQLWSGIPRNVGIERATGDAIAYLDTDDMMTPDHLQFIATSFDNNPAADWIWFNDLLPIGDGWHVNKCSVNHYGRCGTANIAHRRSINVRWPRAAQYSTDDWAFIRELKKHNGTHAGNGGYKVCHIPGSFDL